MKARSILLLLLVSTMHMIYGQEMIEIAGAITLENTQTPTPDPGTIRWTGNDFLGWTGQRWVSLTTGVGFDGEVTDIDGNVYPTIKIGNQEWMAENLRTSKFQDGTTAIPQVTDQTDWRNANYGAWCWYDNDPSFEQPYGKLYNWHAVNDGRGICPTGWHVPSDAEWTTFANALGGVSVAGGLLKEAGNAHWTSPNAGATNSSGYTGLPGAARTLFEFLSVIGDSGWFWSSTETSSTNASYYALGHSFNDLKQYDTGVKESGISVRCVRD